MKYSYSTSGGHSDEMPSSSEDQYEYTHRGGRRSPVYLSNIVDFRYHGISHNPYPLPNDKAEKIRLDKLQFCVRAKLGTNIVAPISPAPTQIGTSESTRVGLS
jgi:hypothetical protein